MAVPQIRGVDKRINISIKGDKKKKKKNPANVFSDTNRTAT